MGVIGVLMGGLIRAAGARGLLGTTYGPRGDVWLSLAPLVSSRTLWGASLGICGNSLGIIRESEGFLMNSNEFQRKRRS